MAGLGDTFGRGSIGEQLFVWGLLSQVIQALTDPGVSELRMLMAARTTVEPLSPAELAALAQRGYISTEHAHSEGNKSGVGDGNIDRLIDLAGAVPPPEVLLEALRRGLIDKGTVGDGSKGLLATLVRGGLKPEYADMYAALAVQNPTWNDAMDALLEGQLDRATAEHWYKLAGGNPDAFQWLFDTRGTSPTPDMLGTMANRGIIAWDGTGADKTTFAQGFLEGPWRNKWEHAMRDLMIYHPPPRTVTALLRSGAITQAQALTLFKQQGLSAELAAAYVKDASHHTSVSAKELTKADIESLYSAHAVTKDEATKMLTDLGYSGTSAGVLLGGVDLRRTISATTSAIGRVRTLYTARKITRAAAASSLKDLGVSEAQAHELLGTWDVEKAANIRQLSEAQIVAAFHAEIITQADAQAELEAIGYTPRDGWILLSTHEHKKLPGEPPPGPGPIGVI